jgi:hypothetical protein
MKEKELMEWLRQGIPDLTKSPNETDGYDCISEDFKLYIELKSRNKHYDTLILEKQKFDSLTRVAKMKGLTAWYINYTPEGIWAFLLDSSNQFAWEDKWLPATTEFGGSNKKMKLVTFLDVKNGIQIK